MSLNGSKISDWVVVGLTYIHGVNINILCFHFCDEPNFSGPPKPLTCLMSSQVCGGQERQSDGGVQHSVQRR